MEKKIELFKKKIWDFYKENRRDFEWRQTRDSYKILVSEMMLQQTQTQRVSAKYAAFLKAFPTVSHLNQAKQSDVLKLWQGLGYNRRALYLKRIAKIVCETHNGTFPKLKNQLIELPGIGPNTAGAVIAFAYNEPAVFIETNIRRVFIHEFFREKEFVNDKDLYPLIELSLDQKNPREFYYALMDYGAYLGKQITNPNRKSKHYKKQSTFEGSLRQTRGAILKMLINNTITLSKLSKEFENYQHFKTALDQLIIEGFIEHSKNTLRLKS